MCGLAGFINPNKRFDRDQVLAMAKEISHRGPDAEGSWVDLEAGIALAHRRLSILDLTPTGQQPMSSHSERYVIVFNGEIYNHLEIRNDLSDSGESVSWRGHSDTETLLAAIDCWGFEKTLYRISGMFAFALWDCQEKELYLVRDRVGEKPLYYGVQGGVFLFASELKALEAHPAFLSEIDRNSLNLFFKFNYIPAPYSIYKGIKKLPPGSFLRITPSNCIDGKLQPVEYWSFVQVAKNAKENRFGGDLRDACNELELRLKKSIKQQMVADVPLGAFLSGGIDSSTVVALMQAQSTIPIKTFTIGFDDRYYDEAKFAKRVAKHLGTEHFEFYVSPKDALGVIPQIPKIYDEPFSDSSQIPTTLISKLTRRHVTVSLSGDGGDELFGGYNRYFNTNRWWNRIKTIPFPVRTVLASRLRYIIKQGIFPGSSGLITKLQKLEGVLRQKESCDLYPYFVTHWSFSDALVLGSEDIHTLSTKASFQFENLVDQMMALDTLTYLPDDILVKVDRAAMSVSLETRVPFLDPEIIEFAWSLPLNFRIQNSTGKKILRELLYRYCPAELIERPKRGFAVPLATWLRGPLRTWAESLIEEKLLMSQGYLNTALVRNRWREHLERKHDWSYHLWDVLMFQAWLMRT